jgi:hypothetical protein
MTLPAEITPTLHIRQGVSEFFPGECSRSSNGMTSYELFSLRIYIYISFHFIFAFSKKKVGRNEIKALIFFLFVFHVP